MSNLWERFEGIASPDEVAEAKAKNNFEPVEAGEYKVTLEVLTPAENKDGLPMLKGQFRIIDNNRCIFYNQMLKNINYPDMTAINIADAITFLSAITGEELVYESMSKLEEIINGVQIGESYNIKVSYSKKDKEDMKYPKIKVLSKATNEDDDSLPFEV